MVATTKKTILVVDDNRDAADSLAMLLRREGHTVLVAYDSLTGLDLAQTKIPNIILHDLGMTDPNGFAVASRLRKNPVFAETLLVAVTAYGLTEDRVRARLAGFNHHVTKPFDFTELCQLIFGSRH